MSMPLTCRGCGKSAAEEKSFDAYYGERRPCVSPAARAFTCSRCLLAAPPLEGAEGDRNLDPRRVVAGRHETPLTDPHKQRVSGGGFLSPAGLPKNSKRAGGRPRKHRNDLAARAAAQRAYRERQKQAQMAANDALVAKAGAR